MSEEYLQGAGLSSAGSISPKFPGPGVAIPVVRELKPEEFAFAETVWKEYYEATGDPETDRIFAVLSAGKIVSLARCRRHPDGLEVDEIFTPQEHRKKGYADMVVEGLVEACHNDTLYMHAVRSLAGFYEKYGFTAIPEKDLPSTIRERYTWAGGNMEGAEVQPMRRNAGWITIRR